MKILKKLKNLMIMYLFHHQILDPEFQNNIISIGVSFESQMEALKNF